MLSKPKNSSFVTKTGVKTKLDKNHRLITETTFAVCGFLIFLPVSLLVNNFKYKQLLHRQPRYEVELKRAESEEGISGIDLYTPKYPKLGANIFQKTYDGPACRKALSAYSDITMGSLFSSRFNGGYDYGEWQGFGAYAGKTYDLGRVNKDASELFSAAKLLNPNLKIFSHGGPSKQEVGPYFWGDMSPYKWFYDAMSPKWYAYLPLTPLQEDVKDTNATTFKFLRGPIEALENLDPDYFPNGLEGPEYDHWDYWENDQPSDKIFNWQYFAAFDNDAGGGRGTVEIMPIDYVTYDETYAYVHVATKADGSRTAFGSPQTYSQGDRFGLLPHTIPEWGALAFPTNMYCRSELEKEGNPCSELRVDGVNWLEAKAQYVTEFLMKAKLGNTWLNNGTIMDAENQGLSWNFMGWDRLTRYMDVNFDGEPDMEVFIDEEPKSYKEYEDLIKQAAQEYGRSDGTPQEFLIIQNGPVNQAADNTSLNGLNHEDFNAVFQGTFNQQLQEYVRSYTDPEFLNSPVISIIRERDRSFDPGGDNWDPESELGNNQNNFDEHRNIMAMTLVMGDGTYAHTGSHTTGIPLCDCDPEGFAGCYINEHNDWLDEMSVDTSGVSSNHPDYEAPDLCIDIQGVENCVKDPYYHKDWLGDPLGVGYAYPGNSGVYRRDFKNGIVIYSLNPSVSSGNPYLTIDLEGDGQYKKILGVDLDNEGNLYNDGSVVDKVTLGEKEGIILLRNGELQELRVDITYSGQNVSRRDSVKQGENFNFDIKVTNMTNEEKQFDLWLTNGRPNGAELLIGPHWLFNEENPREVNLDGFVETTFSYTATVPANQPLGENTLNAYVGNYSDEKTASDTLTLEVLPK